MKLDPRIKDIALILSPNEIEEAEKYKGEMCYFANNFYIFNNLDQCPKAKLEKIHYDTKDYPYEWDADFDQYTYMLPVKFVEKPKPKEIKYVPFETIHDLAEAHLHLGNIVNFICDEYPEVIHRAVVAEVNYREVEIDYDETKEEVINITLGSTTFSFDVLCDRYKYLDKNEEWVPFGKRVEE